jgi:hypothetical protein
MIVLGRFDHREFDFTKSETQAELISVSLGWQRGPAIFDIRESQYASRKFRRKLFYYQLTKSMSRRE